MAKRAIPPDRLRVMYIDLGFQYYAAGRCGVASWWNPVAGNLMHHAIEMFLKGGLCPHTTIQERKNMGHDLRIIWQAFKARYDPTGKLELSRFDRFVRALQGYEEIRYPEKMARDGMGSYFQFGKRTTPVKTSGKAANVPKYELFVAEADAMVKAVCDASRVTPKAYTSRYQQEPGRTYLRYEIVETDLF